MLFLNTMLCCSLYAQSAIIISGKITDSSKHPLQNATVHLKGSSTSTMSKIDGSFRLLTDSWHDSLQITRVGLEKFTVALQQGHTNNLTIEIKSKPNALQEVVVSTSKKPGKTFMQKVIDHKASNNPSRFRSRVMARGCSGVMSRPASVMRPLSGFR